MPETSSAGADFFNSVIESALPVVHGMGLQALEVGRGTATTTVPIEGNGNHFGAMYAGVLFSVAEVLGGAIALASFDNTAFYPLVKDLQINFRKAATTDVTATAAMTEEELERVAATAEAEGKCDFVLEATVTDTNGAVVATTRGLYQLRRHGR